MKAALLAVLAAGCARSAAPASAPMTGGVGEPAPAATAPAPVAEPPPAPARPDDAPAIDWASVSWATDDDAAAIWPRLGLTWENWHTWQARLDAVPESPGLREAMARGLLRGGNFACPSVATPIGCGTTFLEHVEPAPTAGIEDPCVRRAVATWALDQLDDASAQPVIADIVALAALPAPEETLVRAAFAAIPDDPDTQLAMVELAHRAGNPVVAHLVMGLPRAQLEAAVTDLHIDAALDALDVGTSTAVFERAAADARLRPETRARVIAELADLVGAYDDGAPEAAGPRAAIARAARDPECAVAAAAVVARAALDGGAPRVSPPTSARGLARAVCIATLAGVGADGWRALVPAGGLTVTRHYRDPGRLAELRAEFPDEPDVDGDGAPDVPEADPDGDGDPTTWAEVERVRPADDDPIDPDGELARALRHCDGLTCAAPHTGITFRLVPRRKGRHYLLDAIDRHEAPPDCTPRG